jgi:hypothetical protein
MRRQGITNKLALPAIFLISHLQTLSVNEYPSCRSLGCDESLCVYMYPTHVYSCANAESKDCVLRWDQNGDAPKGRHCPDPHDPLQAEEDKEPKTHHHYIGPGPWVILPIWELLSQTADYQSFQKRRIMQVRATGL